MARGERPKVSLTSPHRFDSTIVQIEKMHLPEGSGVDAHGEDASVMPVVGKVFGGAVLIRRSPSRR